MAQKKTDKKMQDLAPKKDAKGGAARRPVAAQGVGGGARAAGGGARAAGGGARAAGGGARAQGNRAAQ